ncbi:hypothetical protein ACH4PU_00785 [Streptomyces sp. NPDC021100]|uniref:hypothetical protein n=1 Tax=Streptomyces sp. NPDC021100 TaxID=3365114 RepID=UPI0037B585D0
MAWNWDGEFWVGPKTTLPVWIGWGSWLGPTYIQAMPISPTGKKLFVMDQAMRNLGNVVSGTTIQGNWQFGADIYNPNDVWVSFRLFGLD